MPKVKCADCGFLAVRHTQTRELLDAEQMFREYGGISRVPIGQKEHADTYDQHPLCFVRACRLQDEINGVPDSEKRRVVCQKLRECDQFTPWHQGFTPKEHKDMLISAETRRIEAEMRQEEREWIREQARLDKQWKLIELCVMGGIVTVVSAVIQIIAAYIQRGN